MENLFAPGTKNNPNDQARKEQQEFQAWQQSENERLEKEQEIYLAQRIALMNTMTEQEWESFLEAEAIENAKARAQGTKQYELR